MLRFELPSWFLAQGVIAWPLLACSVLTFALLLERGLTLLWLPRLRDQDWRRAAHQCLQIQDMPVAGNRAGWRHGVSLLQAHTHLSRTQREELLSVWLAHLQQQLHRRLRLLQLIGVLSPMLGLLGTVLGMLAMFQAIAADGGPVTPGVLADGLFQALYSTAWGLLIALPALGGGQALGLCCSSYIERVQQLLNRCLLAMDGLQTDLLIAAPSRSNGWAAQT